MGSRQMEWRLEDPKQTPMFGRPSAIIAASPPAFLRARLFRLQWLIERATSLRAMSQTERIQQIVHLLETSRYPVPIDRFLDDLEVSRATFNRDIEYLRDRLGAPIEWESGADGKGRGYVLRGKAPGGQDGHFGIQGLWFNQSEIHALLVMHRLTANMDPGLLSGPGRGPAGADHAPAERGRGRTAGGPGKDPGAPLGHPQAGPGLVRGHGQGDHAAKAPGARLLHAQPQLGDHPPGLAQAPAALPRELVPVGLVPHGQRPAPVLARCHPLCPDPEGGRAGLRQGIHAEYLVRDVAPDRDLIADTPPGATQGFTHLGRLACPPRGKMCPRRARELCGLRPPAPGLDTRDRDHDRLAHRCQHAEIQDPVLLGTDQFLAVEQQHGDVAVVDEAKLGHAAQFRCLGNPGATAGQGIAEEHIVGALGSCGEQRVYGEIVMQLGFIQGHLGQSLGNG